MAGGEGLFNPKPSFRRHGLQAATAPDGSHPELRANADLSEARIVAHSRQQTQIRRIMKTLPVGLCTPPSPADFFRTMEEVGGRRLDWFWRGWFLENARYDQSIDSVVVATVGDTTKAAVLFGNRERGVLPLRVRFTFSDRSEEHTSELQSH